MITEKTEEPTYSAKFQILLRKAKILSECETIATELPIIKTTSDPYSYSGPTKVPSYVVPETVLPKIETIISSVSAAKAKLEAIQKELASM